ncbi:MAG: hypothetical protein AB7F99_10195 [Vicinamibacterales bacterium]
MPRAIPGENTKLAAVSLVLGPLIMSVGDLLHPEESMDPAVQAALMVGLASRWYVAHLMLFFGILILIPGILAISGLAMERTPRSGFAARVLTLVGGAAFAGVFVGEVLIGRYVSDGADVTAATRLLATFQSGPVLGAVMIGGLAFFLGVGALAVPMIRAGGSLRWPALAFAAGAILIAVEISTAQVLLSRIGNFAFLAGGILFARYLVQRQPATSS